MKKRFAFVFTALVLAGILYGVVHIFMPLPSEHQSVEIEIPKGATYRQVAEILSQNRIIRDKNLFLLLGRLYGIDRKIRAGYYSLSGPSNLLDLLELLRKGRIVEYDITVIEGDSLQEIAAKLSEKGILPERDFWQLATDKAFLVAHSIDAPSLEGFLFPDTYRIPKGADPKEVVEMMIHNLRDQFTEKLRARAAEIGMTEREVLTLASIIEKEAATDEERPLISAVYHNRLRKRIPLQADPTAIYGIKNWGEKITADDLRRKSPYNTYIVNGLPPGPIASSGLKSIVAALYPADVPYMYFVSNNDGTHRFSVTAEEHAAAVRAYREKKQAENDRKKSEENQRLRELHGST